MVKGDVSLVDTALQRQSASQAGNDCFTSRDDDASTVQHCVTAVSESNCRTSVLGAAAEAAVCWPATLDRAALEKQELYETIRRLREILNEKSDELQFLRESWVTLQEGTVSCDVFEEMKLRLSAENERLSQRVAELEDTCSELRGMVCAPKRDVHISLTGDVQPEPRRAPPGNLHPFQSMEGASAWCNSADLVVAPHTHRAAPTKHAAVQSIVETRCVASQTVHVPTLDVAATTVDSMSPPSRVSRGAVHRHVHCQTSAPVVAPPAPPPLQPVSVVLLARRCRHVGIQCSTATKHECDADKPPTAMQTAHRPVTAVRHAAVQAAPSDVDCGLATRRRAVATQTSRRKDRHGVPSKLELTLASVHQRLELLRSDNATELSRGTLLGPETLRGPPANARLLLSLPKIELIVPPPLASIPTVGARPATPLLRSEIDVVEDNRPGGGPSVAQSHSAERRRAPLDPVTVVECARERSVSPRPCELVPRAAVQIPVPMKRLRSCGTSPLQRTPTSERLVESRVEYLEKRWQRAQAAFLESLQHIQGENALLRQILFGFRTEDAA